MLVWRDAYTEAIGYAKLLLKQLRNGVIFIWITDKSPCTLLMLKNSQNDKVPTRSKKEERRLSKTLSSHFQSVAGGVTKLDYTSLMLVNT